tara:strand:- start:581 stop:763 length:183 start_codon:yes stop_codon:yes gene_type:complete
MEKIHNIQLSKDLVEIIALNYTFTEGTVSGNSIEVKENNTSYIYYEDKKSRDNDLRLLRE